MDAQAIITVSAAVVSLTQLVKLVGLPDKLGPVVVLFLAAVGVLLYGYSAGTFERAQTFAYFAAWILVATSGVGVYKLARAAPPPVAPAEEPATPGGGSVTVES